MEVQVKLNYLTMSEKQLEKVDFEIIRYANCWEDADVLIAALELNSDSSVMSIASAGDNCFSLASKGADKVIAFDISLVQLHLVELKSEAIRQMNREEYMRFVGMRADESRLNRYTTLRPNLSKACQNYWDGQQDALQMGVIHAGKFEQYFQTFVKDYLPTVHAQAVVDGLLKPKSEDEQHTYYDEVWHTEEWEKLYRNYFGEKTLGDKGRDPEFLKHVVGSVAEMNLRRATKHLRTATAQRNYFLHYILNNQFERDLPHYVREENYADVKANIDRIVLHHGLMDSALIAHPNCSHFNLSDIFEYMDEALFELVGNQILERSAPGVKIAYWNLLIERNLASTFPEKLSFDAEKCQQLNDSDLGYFYRGFILNTKK
jgi:S-adenosylmethionine-diacylglycerol 3-amino-3-carboxypropyl transferase